jgi:hypothetical protein
MHACGGSLARAQQAHCRSGWNKRLFSEWGKDEGVFRARIPSALSSIKRAASGGLTHRDGPALRARFRFAAVPMCHAMPTRLACAWVVESKGPMCQCLGSANVPTCGSLHASAPQVRPLHGSTWRRRDVSTASRRVGSDPWTRQDDRPGKAAGRDRSIRVGTGTGHGAVPVLCCVLPVSATGQQTVVGAVALVVRTARPSEPRPSPRRVLGESRYLRRSGSCAGRRAPCKGPTRQAGRLSPRGLGDGV